MSTFFIIPQKIEARFSMNMIQILRHLLNATNEIMLLVNIVLSNQVVFRNHTVHLKEFLTNISKLSNPKNDNYMPDIWLLCQIYAEQFHSHNVYIYFHNVPVH